MDIKHKLNSGINKTWCGKPIRGVIYVFRWANCTCPECLEKKERGWYNAFVRPTFDRVVKEPDMVKLRAYFKKREQ